jgi:hypothetical protein
MSTLRPRLRIHLNDCSKRARGIGSLEPGSLSKATRPNTSQGLEIRSRIGEPMLSGTASSGGSGHSYPSQLLTFYQGREHFDFLASDETQHLHVLFSRAIHRGATPFTMFEIQHWYAIFSALRNSFKLPSPEILAKTYCAQNINVMSATVNEIAKCSDVCMSLDGATKIKGKQILNLMACGLVDNFFDHFAIELRRESADNLLKS